MNCKHIFGLSLCLFGYPHWLVSAQQHPNDPTSIEFFERRIRPVLVEHCYSCHGAVVQVSGLRVDSRLAILKGGARGTSIAPGIPGKSLLVKAVQYTDLTVRMPPKGKLKDDQIADIEKWVQMGAPFPLGGKLAPAVMGKPAPRKSTPKEDRTNHWSYKPVRSAIPPSVRNTKWVTSPVDNFILAKLESAGLVPSAPADKRDLIRRVTFDLTGLPPTRLEVDTFLNDKSAKAFEKVVDRLLASPRYGERWARHWLDLVRYCETLGHEFDFDIFNAWRYRDYVIRAFNEDVPYNKFVLEHVAGDLIPNPRRNPADGMNESIVATGFWWMGEGKHSPVDVRQEQADRMDNQIDVFSKAFMGQTMACARCHDHKFDPITSKDYYALAGYLRSSRYQNAYLDPPSSIDSKVMEMETIRKSAAPMIWNSLASQSGQIAKYLVAATALGPTKPDPNKVTQISAADGLDPTTLLAWQRELFGSTALQIDHPLWLYRKLTSVTTSKFGSERDRADSEIATQLERIQTNLRNDLNFAKINSSDNPNWTRTGAAFGEGVVQPGEVAWNPEVRTFVPIPAGAVNSKRISPRLEGVLRSKNFIINHKYILVKCAGMDSRVDLIIDGFNLVRGPIYDPCNLFVRDEQMKWRVMDVHLWKGHSAYLELVDSVIPNLSQGSYADAGGKTGANYLTVESIRFEDNADAVGVEPHGFNHFVAAGSPNSTPELAENYANVFRKIAQRIASGDPVNAALAKTQQENRAATLFAELLVTHKLLSPDIPKEIVANYGTIESVIPAPTCAPTLVDGPGEDENIFLRGSHKTLGARAPRTLLAVAGGTNQPAAPTNSSGRMDLALKLVSPSNPLFARVMVNRLWKHHFGEGIVRSPDDFGHMGQKPTHPELLDFLATEFVNRKWSVKSMHKLMLLSSTYKMSVKAHPQAVSKDPQNKLLNHMPVRRLEAEAVRDTILSCSGRLNEAMSGRSVFTYLNSFVEGRGRPESGPLDGNGRRSIYIGVRRNFLTPMFLAFDFPIPFSCNGKRTVSNVPAQALSLMNGPFVLEQAGVWARRLLADTNSTSEQKVMNLYQTAYSRPPTALETAGAIEFLSTQGKRYSDNQEVKAWTDLCHVIINVKEFIFIN